MPRSNSEVYATTTNHMPYVRCTLCRLKFQTTSLGRLELLKHGGSSECLKRKADKKMQNSSANSHRKNVVQVSSGSVPQGDIYAPIADSSGTTWTQKCDRCEHVVKLGNGNNQSAFESHRRSHGCQEKRRLLKARRQLEQQKGLMNRYIKRTSSQTALGSGQASGGTHKTNTQLLTVPAKEKKNKSDTVGGNRELKPSDANITTLARDLRRALAEIPSANKRKNEEELGNSMKKFKAMG